MISLREYLKKIAAVQNSDITIQNTSTNSILNYLNDIITTKLPKTTKLS